MSGDLKVTDSHVLSEGLLEPSALKAMLQTILDDEYATIDKLDIRLLQGGKYKVKFRILRGNNEKTKNN